MSPQDLRRRILQSIVMCVLLAAGVLTAWSLVPEARQREAESLDPQRERSIKLANWHYRELCPPGHQTEVVLGKTHLRLELRILTNLTLRDFQEVPDGCPTEAIHARSISFYYWTKELHAIYLRHGLRLDQLILDQVGPGAYAGPADIAENPAKRWIIESVGMVDDVTDAHPHPQNILHKSYRLQHLGDAGDPSWPYVFMTCSGDPARKGSLGRHCQTYYRLNGDLRVHYTFRQDKQYDHPERFWKLPPTGPIKEPEGFLIMDAGVRAWIREMQQASNAQ